MLCIALFLVVAAVYLPSLRDGFITYDDPVYVTGNAHVTGGLTRANFNWALHSTEASNWHPLTWLSHMADCDLYGLNAWGHHLTNVLLHALNACLLFVALRKMTGALWQSLFVAALFGLHPLHVESVVWISERKDLLSTLFLMLALWAYGARAERKRFQRPGAGACYGLALLFFALGLMCKPMIVTLPCVFLLLDYWPLRRREGPAARSKWALVIEKIPFFALGAAACAVTLLAQSGGDTIASTEDFPLSVRLSNAVLAYSRYLKKCFLPEKLAVFYPFTGEQAPLGALLMAASLLALVTGAAVVLARKRPYLLVGWLWFLGTLVPAIGLVQVGGQAMADRYTYVPLVGVFIMVSWGAGDAAAAWKKGSTILGIGAAAVLAALTCATERQLAYWRDGASLFRHAIAVTDDNWVAPANLYATLSRSSSPGAGEELRKTLNILAAFAMVHEKKGAALERVPGRSAEAIKEYKAAVRIMPDLAGPHFALGAALARMPGKLPQAIEEFRTAVRLDPDFAEAHYDLGIALSASADTRFEAVEEYESVVRIEPGDFQAHYNLGYLLSLFPGREADSMAEYEAAVRLRPASYQAQFNLGLALAAVPGRGAEAVSHFEAALAAKPDLVQARRMIERLRAANPQLQGP